MTAQKFPTKVILLEFNELTPSLMERFLGSGHLKNFSKFRSESIVYETMAAEVSPNLEPWIQWVTVHTGLDYCDHQLFHLNEGHKLNAPRIWDVMSRNGYSSLVFGSMNANAQEGFKGFLLPDPWCSELSPSKEFADFFRFVQKNVLEYSNDRVPLTSRDYAKVVGFLASHGLSFSTAMSILKQLLHDRGGRFRWKRAVLLDKLMFDVFQWYWRTYSPSFSTFFANSTAHFQHSYWRNMEPELFPVKPTNPKPDEYENAIRFGYEQMDYLIGRFMKLADENTLLVFSTAISQQPCLKYEESGGAFFHRSKDFSKFLDFAVIRGYSDVAPVMTHQFHIDFQSDELAIEAEAKLKSYQLNGSQLLQVDRTNNRLFAGCRIYQAIDLSQQITSQATGATSPLSQFFYRMETNKSGMHHPIGMLWLRNPRKDHEVHASTIPLNSVADLLLEPFHLAMPQTTIGSSTVTA